jgi:hypothetical protein
MGTKFKLPNIANTYWNKLNDNSSNDSKDSVKLNFYWLCAQLGIVYDKRKELDGVETTDKFTAKLDPHSSMIRGLILAGIWRYREVKKNDVQDQLIKLLSADNFTKISSDGIDILDNFAAGGFQMIEKNIPSKHGWNYFMMKYHSLMQNAPSFEYSILE